MIDYIPVLGWPCVVKGYVIVNLLLAIEVVRT